MELSTLRGDLAGGLTSAVLTIPVSMSFGALAFSGLGEAWVPLGVLSGLVSSVVVGATAAILRSPAITAYGPRPVVASLIGVTVLQALEASGGARPETPERLLYVVFLVSFTIGLFQAVFGVVRVGSLVRYIPSPVMAGFQDAAAVLIVLSQLDTLLGLPGHVSPGALPSALRSVQPLTLLVGLVTIGVTWYGGRLVRRGHPAVLALIAGCAAYYLIRAAGPASGLGPVVGAVPSMLPTPSSVLAFVRFVTGGEAWPLLPWIASGAASLAVVASLDSLLSAKLVETVTGQRSDANGELMGLGVGSMAAACLGGIPGGVNVGPTVANHAAGGRTRASVLTGALAILVVVVFLGPVIGGIPKVVLAGLLVGAALALVDRTSLAVARKLLSGELTQWRRAALDLAVVAVVAGLTITVDLIVAVAAGVVIAVLSFLFRMSRSVVRRTYRADAVHSKRMRDPRLMELLQAHGHRVLVMELEGPLFFGTAEALARRIEGVLEEVECIVLDLKRVNEIDSTGARILLHLHTRMGLAGRHLLLSHLPGGRAVAGVLWDIGVTAAFTPERIFADTDRALEWAEEHLLARLVEGRAFAAEQPLEEMALFADLAPAQRTVLREALERRTYGRGAVVFREGDAGRELFLIARGTASVKVRLTDQERETRLATFSPGTVFGEIALLDQGPRSATVEADDDLVCYVLTRERFEALARQDQGAAVALVTGLARELSQRLRRATRAISELEN